MEKGSHMLNAVLTITAAGQGTANNRMAYRVSRNRNLLPIYPDLGNAFNLFFHRGKQVKLKCRKSRRRRNDGFIARRLFFTLIYL